MSLRAGTYTLGPESGTLSVKTGRTGAAAKAGHNLLIDVAVWQATLDVGDDPAQTTIVLDADAASLRVREGTGGMQALGDDDKASIVETIDDEVLKRQGIAFRSTAVQVADDGRGLAVQGELTLVGRSAPIAFDVTVGGEDGLSGSVVIKQTDWGITPYSTLFGALKVVDEVEVTLDAVIRPADAAHVAGVAPIRSSPRTVGRAPAHPGAPPADRRASNIAWAVFFFLFLWFGMVAVDVSHGTALPLAVMASFLIFLLVRAQGGDR